MYSLNNLIYFLLIKKLIKSGNQHKSISLKKNLLLLINDKVLLYAILKLIVPITFKIKKIGYIKYQIPTLTHYYKSINLALIWLIKAAKIKSFNKMPFIKALYLECYDVLKKQGIAYNYKQQYIKKSLTNRIFIYLIKK
uniref:Ribosomal protein S7 n=1 Tax=Eimeria tenella TaxID=5802 RepID=O78340_EIMTE|nr:ribosomal protein S7 [Eimeria tenella]